MNTELARAQQVWRDAQQAVLDAQSALDVDSSKEAQSTYKDAVLESQLAKQHYDAVRAEVEASVMFLPRVG